MVLLSLQDGLWGREVRHASRQTWAVQEASGIPYCLWYNKKQELWEHCVVLVSFNLLEDLCPQIYRLPKREILLGLSR